jgi:hypothetical protein
LPERNGNARPLPSVRSTPRSTRRGSVTPFARVAITQSHRRVSCRQPLLPQNWAEPFNSTTAVVPFAAMEKSNAVPRTPIVPAGVTIS